jgi:hypothetical protein
LLPQVLAGSRPAAWQAAGREPWLIDTRLHTPAGSGPSESLSRQNLNGHEELRKDPMMAVLA